MRIVIAGGGTAGHVFPALALAARLVADHHEVSFAGTASGQEARLVPAAGYRFEVVDARPLERRLTVRTLRAPVTAVRSIGQAAPLVAEADVVLGMGGYVSVPVALAALRSRRPLVLHEQNAVPGLANRTLARPARAVALAFGEARRAFPRSTRTTVTGNPVRDAILRVPGERGALADEARRELDLDPDRRTLVVLGGSQGALHVNRAVVEAIGRMEREDLQVVMLTGQAHAEATQASLPASTPTRVRVLAFLERMDLAYAVADLVVARAGATTVAELAVCGLPAIVIPYPYATGRHQEANARALQRAGGASMLLDDELDGRVLADRISWLLDDEERRAAMAERSRAWGRPDAAEALARVVLDAGGAS